jgi:hypothetical protein
MEVFVKPHLLLAAVALVACGSPKSSAPEPAAQQVATPAPMLPQGRRAVPNDTPPAEPAPEGVAELDSLLRAWHKEDLPTKDALDAHSDAGGSLMWLAKNGDVMSVRVRALNLLRHYPDAETADLLLAVATDDSAHPTLQAAAIRGMAGQDLGADERLREAAVNGLASSDIRVGLAAVEVLAKIDDDGVRTALQDAATNDATPEKVREAAQAASE